MRFVLEVRTPMRVAVLSAPWLAAAALVASAPPAAAGCSSGCSSCCLPSTHTVTIPGVTVTPPAVSIAPPAVSIAGGVGSAASVDVSVSTSVNSSSSAQAYAQAAGSASASSSAGAVSSGAVANLISGGGGVFVDVGGPSSSFGPITVESPAPAPSAPVCVDWRTVAQVVALQASCVDDKSVPHPASQVMPGREVASTYEGEVFRCIAGSHMQFTQGRWTGVARFDGGRTVVCQKGEALWREAAGALVCRPQKPARDCNERSLLRRFGAGIKLVSSAARTCVQWTGGRTMAQQDSGASLALGFGGDGGVGR